MIECVFERVYRRLDEPRRVNVELGRALDLARRSVPADRVPLWLRAAGLRIEPVTPGLLLAWARLADAQYLGQVQIEVCNSIRPAENLTLTLWVTQDAIRAL